MMTIPNDLADFLNDWLAKAPYEIWCIICTSLELEDIISANGTCKTWYASLNDKLVWEVAIKRTLSGYPLERITVPSVLSQLERPASMDLTKPGQIAAILEDWTHSYKQRAIFLAYVIKVQQELIGIMRSRTKGVFTTGESGPLFSGTFLADIEDQAGGYIPFDLLALVGTSYFTNPYIWKLMNRRTTFAAYENMALRVTKDLRRHNCPCADIHDGVNEETLEYLRGVKTLVFATAPEDGELIYHLLILLDVSIPETSGVAKNLKTRSLDVDMAKLRDGRGRVFASRIGLETDYHLTWLTESFTDYLIQYAGLIIKYNSLPYYTEIGFDDFTTYSARNKNLPSSVLLPQSLDISEYDSRLGNARF